MEYGAVASWWVVFVGLGAVGLPIASVLLRTLPDRGAALALPTSLVVVFLSVYWLGHVRFGPAVVAIASTLLAGVSIVVVRRWTPRIDLGRFAEWIVVFTLAFLLLIAVRAVDPSVVPGGGEKFLDYGILRSILRSTRLPPEDMWFAGEPIAYYYGGHLIAASLATLTATPPAYAYNLALAGFYAMLVGTAYGVAGSMAADRGRSYRQAGALGAFLVGIASNVAPLVQGILWVLPDDGASRAADAIADRTALPAEQLIAPDTFSYWTASRVIPGTINEFPLFAFLNGDLHAHMSGTPFLLLVVGICLAYARTPAPNLRRRRLLVFGAVPAVGGLLAVVNTWSVPTSVGVTGLAVLFADAPTRDLLPRTFARHLPVGDGVRDEVGRMVAAGLVAFGVALLAVLWSVSFVFGPAAGAEGRSIGVLPERSGLLAFLLVHGWFLLVYGLYLVGRADSLVATGRWRPVGAASVAIVVTGVLTDAFAVALLLPLLGLAWYLLRRDESVGFETVLFVAGAGLVLLVEFLFVEEQAGPGRYNTVFKTYMDVWVLWAAGAGAALASFLPRPDGVVRWRQFVGTGLVVLLVASSSIYGVVALAGHFADAPEPTLDATTSARTYHAQEWEAIEYLDRQPGRPTIVTAPGCWCNTDDSLKPYRWVNAPSSFTGVPTVAGWAHEVGYRGEGPYEERVDDVRTIYTGSTAERRALLDAYDVRYVYVGPNEEALYGETDVEDSPGLSVAFQNDEVTIYAVDQGRS